MCLLDIFQHKLKDRTREITAKKSKAPIYMLDVVEFVCLTHLFVYVCTGLMNLKTRNSNAHAVGYTKLL
jgi:hypothetical protein